MWGMRFGHMMGGGGFMILFWVLIIGGAVYLINSRNSRSDNYHQGKPEGKQAEEIAKERYARGEIDKEELEEILEELRK